MAAEIPGFYYDEERGRYFKITNTGQAVARGMGGYSKSHLANKEREIADKKKRTEGQIKPIFLHKLALHEKLQSSSLKTREDLAVQLVGKRSCPQKWMIDGGYGADNIESMGYDPVKDEVILGLRSGRGYGFNRGLEEYKMVRPFSSRVTSIDISGRMLLMTSFGSGGHGGRVTLSEIVDDAEEEAEGRRVGIYVQNNLIEFFGDKKDTIWSSKLLDGGGRVIIGGKNKASVWHDLKGPVSTRHFHTGSDCLTVDGRDKDAIVGVGCRNGKVKLFDCREQHPETVQSIKHGSSVTKMQRIDDRYVVVSGVEDNLALYDLRYLNNHNGGTYKRDRNGERKSTRPIIKYYGYENRMNMDHGFSINNGTYLAVSSRNHVNIYDVRNGSLLNQLEGMANCLSWDNFGCLYVGQRDCFLRHSI